MRSRVQAFPGKGRWIICIFAPSKMQIRRMSRQGGGNAVQHKATRYTIIIQVKRYSNKDINQNFCAVYEVILKVVGIAADQMKK